jgi:hypothetical protein
MKVILFDAANTRVWLDHAWVIELPRGTGVETGEVALPASPQAPDGGLPPSRTLRFLRARRPGTSSTRG